MSSVISSIIRCHVSAPPPCEVVAAFAPGHAEPAYYCGGEWYKLNHRPLGWQPEKWRFEK